MYKDTSITVVAIFSRLFIYAKMHFKKLMKTATLELT